MSVLLAISDNKIKNSGGSAMSAGSNNGSSPLDARLKSKSNNVGVFGSTPVMTNDVTFGKAALFNQLNDITDTLNTLYQPLRPELAQSIHNTESDRTYFYTTAFRNGYYNMFTGDFFVQPSVSLTSFASDHAANPSRDVPGELTYRTGSKLPLSADYEKKTG